MLLQGISYFTKSKQYVLVLFIGAIQKIISAICMSISAAYQATVLVMLSTFYTEMAQNYSNLCQMKQCQYNVPSACDF